MTITIQKERLRALLLAERREKRNSLDDPFFGARCSSCREHVRDWLIVTDADLDREARDFAAYGDLKEAAREVIRSQVDPVEDRTAAIEKLARLVGSE